MAVDGTNTIPFFNNLGKQKGLHSVEYKPFNISGGDKRDRTADLLNAIQALSQLSYTPEGDMLFMKLLYRNLQDFD